MLAVGEHSRIGWQTVLEEMVVAAERDPARAAVSCGADSLTYLELMTLSGELAGRLLSRGGDPERLVGVYLNRSVNTIAAVLGVLRAGRGYVPLDPQTPSERIRFILQDAGISTVVASAETSHALVGLDVQTVRVDSSLDGATAIPPPVFPAIARDDPAYVMYTSGSTGTPKGVLVSHGNLAYSTAVRLQYYEESPDRFLLLSPFTFDSSVAGIFWTLATGGTLIIPREGDEQNDRVISELIASTGVTHTLCLPSMYAKILEAGKCGSLQSLRVAIVAGEACPVALARLHKKSAGQARLYNEYGPTEATVWSSVYRVTGEERGVNLPIGEPIPGTNLLVLDEDGSLVKSGDRGEIYISGPGVAQGYTNDQALTEASFSENPFVHGKSVRMYKTGDTGAWKSSGELEFLGRSDDQIKVRGFRIEPGEVEGALLAVTGVQEAAVCVRDDTLLGFVVPREGAEIGYEALSKHLEQTLPPYMVPSTFAIVDQLSHLPNGKIDRKALTLDQVSSKNSDFKLPGDSLEFNLRGLFEEILQVHPIGISDSFFDLGGHSLRAIELVNEIERLFGVVVPLPLIFNAPTVQDLAAYLRSNNANDAGNPVIALKGGKGRTPLFCVPGVGGHALRHLILPRYLKEYQPYYVLQARGFDGEPCLDRIEDIASHYLNAMREVAPHGPYLLAGECFGGIVAFEMAQQLIRQKEKVELLVLIECFIPDNGLTLVRRLVETAYARYPRLFEWFRCSRRNPGADRNGGDSNQIDKVTNGRPSRRRKSRVAGREFVYESVDQFRNNDRLKGEATHYEKVRAANRSAGSHYHPAVYPGKITMLLTDKPVPAFIDRRIAWRRFTRVEPDIHEIAGNANTMLREPDVTVLADKLNLCLNDAHARLNGSGGEGETDDG